MNKNQRKLTMKEKSLQATEMIQTFSNQLLLVIKHGVFNMLITFFDSKGIIHKECFLSCQTVTAKYYLKVLKRLMARIRLIRPEYRDPKSWSLLHDNASSHNAIIVCQCLAQNQVCVLNNYN